MPVTIQWLDEQQSILLHNYNGRWTPPDAYQVADDTVIMLATLDHPVDLIVDFTGSRSKVTNVLQFVKDLEERTSPNQRLVVAVNFDTYLKSMLLLAQPTAPKLLGYLHFVSSRDEALRVIEDYRSHSTTDQVSFQH